MREQSPNIRPLNSTVVTPYLHSDVSFNFFFETGSFSPSSVEVYDTSPVLCSLVNFYSALMNYFWIAGEGFYH
jgi:hypothetical protein